MQDSYAQSPGFAPGFNDTIGADGSFGMMQSYPQAQGHYGQNPMEAPYAAPQGQPPMPVPRVEMRDPMAAELTHKNYARVNRIAAREKESADMVVSTVTGFGIFAAILWLAPLSGNFYDVEFNGNGIRHFDVSMGVTRYGGHFEEDARSGRQSIEDPICGAFDSTLEENTVSGAVGRACMKHADCTYPEQACDIYSQASLALWLPLLLFPLCSIFEILTAVLLNYYWRSNQSTPMRRKLKGFSSVGPLVGLAAITGFFILSPDFAGLPRAWVPVGGLSGSVLFRVLQTRTKPFGLAFYMSCFAMTISGIRGGLLTLCMTPHPTEKDETKMKLRDDDDRSKRYYDPDMASPGPPGQTASTAAGLPQGPYGATPQGAYAGSPQGPYGGVPQGPYGGPPQGPYGGAPQGQFGGPPQGPWAAG